MSSRSVIKATINGCEIGLFEADWKWNIGIRVGLKFDWHKLMPRHLAHSRHDPFVKGILADCVTQRKRAGGDDREHVFARGLKVFCSHWQLSQATPSTSFAPDLPATCRGSHRHCA